MVGVHPSLCIVLSVVAPLRYGVGGDLSAPVIAEAQLSLDLHGYLRCASLCRRSLCMSQSIVGPVCSFGEEAGLELGAGSGEYVWVLDPIDGTKSFITGR